MRLYSSFVLCVLLIAGSPSVLGQRVAPRANKKFIIDRTRVLAFDTSVEPIGPFVAEFSLGSDIVRWTKLITVPAKYEGLSIHLLIEGASVNGSWELRFKTSNVIKDVITSESERGKCKSAWSVMIPGNTVVVELAAESAPTGLAIVIDQYSHPVEPTARQAIYGKNYLLGITGTTSDIQRVGQAVARLRISTDRGEALCTGFLVSSDLIVTNYHCVQTNTEAANTQVDFGFDTKGEPLHTFRMEKLEVTNSDTAFDYVVARVSGKPGQTFQPLVLTSTKRVSFNGISNKLVVIGHPKGGPKQVSIRNCNEVSDSIAGIDPGTKSDFSHMCNTLGGSSGSPVFSLDTKELVGLHHLGDAVGKTGGASLVNQAVYIGYIVEDIQKQKPAIIGEIVSKTP
jgi:V8-like Glu-specific endopeptidase